MFIEVVNMLVNLSLAFVLCTIVWILQMSRIKYLLVGLFSLRFLWVLMRSIQFARAQPKPRLSVLVGLKLAFLQSIKSSPHWNITPDNATGAMLSAAILNASMVITCLPFLRPLMEYLQPGWSTSDISTGFLRAGFGYSNMESRLSTTKGSSTWQLKW